MTATAGLLLALVCLTIIAAGFAIAITACRPRPGAAPAYHAAIAAGFGVGSFCFLLGALHWIAALLT